MGINVLFHDDRLVGATPSILNGAHYEWRRRVGSSSRIANDVVALCQTLGRARTTGSVAGETAVGDVIDRIAILCHGYEDQSHECGYGLEFCEDLTVANVGLLDPLGSILIREIFIYGCGAAHIASGTAGRPVNGNGHFLCSEIARRTRTYVTASTEPQAVFGGFSYADSGLMGDLLMETMVGRSAIDMGEWEGLVVRYDPLGNLVPGAERRYPSM